MNQPHSNTIKNNWIKFPFDQILFYRKSMLTLVQNNLILHVYRAKFRNAVLNAIQVSCVTKVNAYLFK